MIPNQHDQRILPNGFGKAFIGVYHGAHAIIGKRHAPEIALHRLLPLKLSIGQGQQGVQNAISGVGAIQDVGNIAPRRQVSR